jgi:hypothetical protein
MAELRRAAPLALAALAVFALGGRRRAGGGARAPAVPPGGGLDAVRTWGEWVEEAGALDGFARFATAAAYTESKGNNLVGLGADLGGLPANVRLKTKGSTAANEAAKACAGWKAAKKRGFYQNNPYGSNRWCFGSGGWFAFLPSTGLSAGGTKGPYANADPFLVFYPVDSVVMMADFVARILRGGSFQNLPHGEKTWLAVRRGMAGSKLVSDYDEEYERSARVRQRLEEALVETGTDPDFMWERPRLGTYPGAEGIRRWLYDHVQKVA